jgi:hypothetical protein
MMIDAFIVRLCDASAVTSRNCRASLVKGQTLNDGEVRRHIHAFQVLYLMKKILIEGELRETERSRGSADQGNTACWQ